MYKLPVRLILNRPVRCILEPSFCQVIPGLGSPVALQGNSMVLPTSASML